jgi:hypothetical protein
MIGYNELGNNGQLGNQMFQYAALLGIAKNRNFNWCIPPREEFGARYNTWHNNKVSSIYDCFKLPLAKNQAIIKGQQINEPTPHYSEELFNKCPDNVSLFGYFQDERYFKHIKDVIKNEFNFHDSIKKMSNRIIEKYNDREKVSIHIRRTDYLHHPDVRSVPSLQYYTEAMSLFKDVTFFIFSDDIQWCKAQSIFRGNNIVFSETYNTYVDLYIMSLCEHNIIANSSFSWWGSYLNKNPNKKIIAPPKHRWLNYRDASHMYLENWIVLTQQ